MDRDERTQSPGEAPILLLAASLDAAVRAVGWLTTAVLYAFMASTAVIVFWLFALAG